MKQFITLAAVLLLSFSLFSQNETGEINIKEGLSSDMDIQTSDTIFSDESQSGIFYDGAPYNFVFEWKHKKKSQLDAHWTGIGLSFMDYNDSKIPNGRLKGSNSYAISLNVASVKKRFGNSNLLAVTGIGFDWHRYHFKNNAALTEVDGITVFKPAPEGIEYKDSKLLAYYITVPLLLEYHFIPNKFYISAGAVGFIKYYSKSQVKYYEGDTRYRPNMGRDLNMRPVDLKLRFQVGISYIKVFGYYSPISMFKGDKGPDLNMYSIGFMVGF